MCIRILLLLTFIIQACTQDSTQVRKYIFATVFDSILLTGNMEEVKSNQIIQWSFIDRLQKSLMLFHSVGVDSPSLSPYYQHRCKYNPTNGTLELQRLELADSGIYQLSVEHYYEHSPDKLYIYSLYLDVEETLSTPLIIQEPVYIANNVQLSCIAKKGNPTTILWLKGKIPITNSSHYTLRDNNSTLSINKVHMDHCGFYTCVAVDSTSEQNITHFLLIDGIQFLHKHVLVTSVVSLISTSMSLAATVFIIFYSLKKYKAHKYQSRMTIVFIIIEMKSYVCLLISSILCILDSGERNIILGTAIFNVIISPLPIYEASLNGANWPAISQHFLLSALAVQWVLKSRQGVRDFSHRVLKQ
ncbi:hepatic and glial cell adhesion molecule isoform X3 [Rhinoraja longicauda]